MKTLCWWGFSPRLITNEIFVGTRGGFTKTLDPPLPRPTVVHQRKIVTLNLLMLKNVSSKILFLTFHLETSTPLVCNGCSLQHCNCAGRAFTGVHSSVPNIYQSLKHGHWGKNTHLSTFISLTWTTHFPQKWLSHLTAFCHSELLHPPQWGKHGADFWR